MTTEPNIIVVQSPERTEYVTKTVNVHEHRAPTDESVKLLKEFEEKAQAKVIEAVHVGNTEFECVIHGELDMMSDQFILLAVFKLNGKQMKAEHRFRPRSTDGHAAIAGLQTAIAQTIAGEILVKSITSSVYKSVFK